MEQSAENYKPANIESKIHGVVECLKCAATYEIRQEDNYELCGSCLEHWVSIFQNVPEVQVESEEAVYRILEECFREDILAWTRAHGKSPSHQSSDYRERALSKMLRNFTDYEYHLSGHSDRYSEDIRKYSLVDIFTNENRLKEYFLARNKK